MLHEGERCVGSFRHGMPDTGEIEGRVCGRSVITRLSVRDAAEGEQALSRTGKQAADVSSERLTSAARFWDRSPSPIPATHGDYDTR